MSTLFRACDCNWSLRILWGFPPAPSVYMRLCKYKKKFSIAFIKYFSTLIRQGKEILFINLVIQKDFLNTRSRQEPITRSLHLPYNLESNLVPRSLVDEAEGEIWQSKKICFSWLAAPFDSCPIPSLTRFSTANFLQTQVIDWKFPRLVKMKSR